MCSICNISISKSNYSKHYKRCYKKHIEKVELEKIIIEKEILVKEKENLQKERDEIEQQYLEFMKQVALKTNSNIVYNDNKSVNMYYIINNYKEANNFDVLMSPDVSAIEKYKIKARSAQAGTYNFLLDRCISDISIDKRPFHCVDNSRNKYLLYTDNSWKVDPDGNRIIIEAIDKVRSVYDTKITRNDSAKVRDKKLKYISDLIDLETTGRKKILKELNKISLIKNTIKKD